MQHLSRADLSFIPCVQNPEYAEITLAPTKNDELGASTVPLVLPFHSTAKVNAC